MSKILVIGDALIDTNVVGKCDRLSPEGPWPIVSVSDETSTLGGAANVAAHISSADIECCFLFKLSKKEPTGSNTIEVFNHLISKHKVEPIPLFCDRSFTISTKKRILAGTHQICRIDLEDTTPPNRQTCFDWYSTIVDVIVNNKIETVIFSDYDKGTLNDELIQMTTNLCYQKNIRTILDPKRPSFMNLKRLTAIKPNGKEIPATNMTANDISWQLKKTALINTIGADGVRVWEDGRELFHLPSVATNVVDVCGAGDSFHSILGIAMHNGYTLQQSVAAGNMASAFAIANRGTYVLTSDEIEQCLQHGRTYFNKSQKN